MVAYYPPVGFHFAVSVSGLTNAKDIHFTDVSGLNVELATEEIAEGGQNRFLQKYPQRSKYPELTLKRGLMLNSELFDWAKGCIENLSIRPKDIDIILLNEVHAPLMAWHLVNAYPTKWSISDFSATKNEIVVESMSLYYQYYNIISIDGTELSRVGI